jgi:hypothetical protein
MSPRPLTLSPAPQPMKLFIAQFDVYRAWTTLLQRLPHLLDVSEPAGGGLHQRDDLVSVAELPVSADEYVALKEADVELHHRLLVEHLHDRHKANNKRKRCGCLTFPF